MGERGQKSRDTCPIVLSWFDGQFAEFAKAKGLGLAQDCVIMATSGPNE